MSMNTTTDYSSAPSSRASLTAEELALNWQLVEELGSEREAAKKQGITRSAVYYRIKRWREVNGWRATVSPKKKKTDAKDRALCEAAWAAWGKYGSQLRAAIALRVSHSCFRTRIMRHREYTGISKYILPSGVEDAKVARYTAAWNAWFVAGSQVKGAALLGLNYSTMLARINGYRFHHHLGDHARPEGLAWSPLRAPLAAK
jgi:hypothetical protein